MIIVPAYGVVVFCKRYELSALLFCLPLLILLSFLKGLVFYTNSEPYLISGVRNCLFIFYASTRGFLFLYGVYSGWFIEDPGLDIISRDDYLISARWFLFLYGVYSCCVSEDPGRDIISREDYLIKYLFCSLSCYGLWSWKRVLSFESMSLPDLCSYVSSIALSNLRIHSGFTPWEMWITVASLR